ncbi:MAG: hypothetical protein B7X95_08625 [Methylophilaceae bacterium 17-44-8]|nr:MAG: hypothetical protein B7X95_08625 [Methylophilaceae bacterium 17-44-8]
MDSYIKKPQYVMLDKQLQQLEDDSTSITNVTFVRQEKEYQLTINDKLKSAADWDTNLSKTFSLG